MSIELKQSEDKEIANSDEIEESNEEVVDELKFQIGNNLIINKKFVFGITPQIRFFLFVIICQIIILITYFIFIFSIFSSKSSLIALVIILPYLPTHYFHIKCFFTEPGIIPRNYEEFQKKDLNEEEIIFYYKNGPKPSAKNETPILMMYILFKSPLI